MKSIISLLGEAIVKVNEPADKHCTFKLGGPLQYFVEPTSVEQLAWCIHTLSNADVPFKIVGNMSNILPSDNLNEGVFICTKKIDEVKVFGRRLVACCGAALGQVINIAANLGLSGLEGLTGIPATIGGATVNNAGAFGYATSDHIESVLVYAGGRVVSISGASCGFGNHTSALASKNIIVLEVTFNLRQSTPQIVMQNIKQIALRRADLQPHAPSAGSVFSKAEGVSAGYYIEQAGLKGEIYNGAQISDVHANFIINLGGATADSVKYLIGLAQQKVKQKFGVMLTPEIEILGETNERYYNRNVDSGLSHPQ